MEYVNFFAMCFNAKLFWHNDLLLIWIRNACEYNFVDDSMTPYFFENILFYVFSLETDIG